MSIVQQKDASGTTQRQRRVGEEVRHALVQVFRQGAVRSESGEPLSITVTEVRMSPDLKNAHVFFLPLLGKDSDVLLATLKKQSGTVRHHLGQHLSLRYTPALRFALDASFEQASRIESLLQHPKVAQDLQPVPL